MNTDLYDPRGKNPARVRHHLVRYVGTKASISRSFDLEASKAKQDMYDAIEAAHGVTPAQRDMGLLSARQIAEYTGLHIKRIEAILQERRTQRKAEQHEREAQQNAAAEA